MQKAADTLHTRSLSAANHLESQSFYFILFTSYISHVDRSTAHATRRGDGRQEGGERGYLADAGEEQFFELFSQILFIITDSH